MSTDHAGFARALSNLRDLALDWHVELTAHAGEWTLTLSPRGTWPTPHTWSSTDLVRLINHAWAGAPDGRV